MCVCVRSLITTHTCSCEQSDCSNDRIQFVHFVWLSSYFKLQTNENNKLRSCFYQNVFLRVSHAVCLRRERQRRALNTHNMPTYRNEQKETKNRRKTIFVLNVTRRRKFSLFLCWIVSVCIAAAAGAAVASSAVEPKTIFFCSFCDISCSDGAIVCVRHFYQFDAYHLILPQWFTTTLSMRHSYRRWTTTWFVCVLSVITNTRC